LQEKLLIYIISIDFTDVLVTNLAKKTANQCQIVGLSWLSDCLAEERLVDMAGSVLFQPPTSCSFSSKTPKREDKTIPDEPSATPKREDKTVPDEPSARAAGKKEWTLRAANQSFNPDWEQWETSLPGTSAPGPGGPTAPVNHNKAGRYHVRKIGTAFGMVSFSC
jgi:hypothetical protein